MKCFFLTIFLFSAITASAQKPDVAVGKVIYEFTHLRDTTRRDKPYQEQMVLLTGRNASVYKSLDKTLREDAMNKDLLDQVKSAPNPNAVALTMTGPPPSITEEIYLYLQDKKLFSEEYLINYYLVEEPFPTMKWKVRKDTTSIGGLHCQKATTRFGGRDYEAWFCPELPFKAGPWKLNGLPGLILEAHDIKNEVTFKFAGFEDISKKNINIALPADDLKAALADIDRLKYVRDHDKAAYMKVPREEGQRNRRNNALSSVDPSKITSINIKGYSGDQNTTVNNPIELPVKGK